MEYCPAALTRSSSTPLLAYALTLPPLWGGRALPAHRTANMFLRAYGFDQDLDTWDTGRVTDMHQMFFEATHFDGAIGSWSTGRVTSFYRMFVSASSFTGDLAPWNTTSLTSYVEMFDGSYQGSCEFTGPTNCIVQCPYNGLTMCLWELDSDVFTPADGSALKLAVDFCVAADPTGVDCSASLYGDPTARLPMSTWNTSLVQSMHSLFEGHSSFNAAIGDWDTSAVEGMFVWPTFGPRCLTEAAHAHREPARKRSTLAHHFADLSVARAWPLHELAGLVLWDGQT